VKRKQLSLFTKFSSASATYTPKESSIVTLNCKISY
jgi:hypothetical protein